MHLTAVLVVSDGAWEPSIFFPGAQCPIASLLRALKPSYCRVWSLKLFPAKPVAAKMKIEDILAHTQRHNVLCLLIAGNRNEIVKKKDSKLDDEETTRG